MKLAHTLIGALGLLSLPVTAHAETVYGLIGGNLRIITFDSAAPNTVASNLAITGLATGTTLTGIDFRPVNGVLYTVTTGGAIYSLANIGASYQATLVSTMTVMPTASNFGYDFNPMADRLRLIGTDGQNLRINVDTGATTTDTTISNGDPRVANPQIVGSAYTNNVAGATSTTLYGIDGATSTLLVSSAPNGGVYNAVGALGGLGVALSGSSPVGFDISGASGVAYLSTGGNDFYTVNLATGAATFVGNIGGGTTRQITGLTVGIAAVPEPATWGMLIMGFGLIGGMIRRRRVTFATA